MTPRDKDGFFSPREEILNSLTHGIGAGLSIAALVILIITATRQGTTWHVVGFTIFGSMLVLLYLASTLYHGIQYRPAKQILRKVDQGAVFLLIAGSYTPFLFTVLRGPWGWSLFGVIWGLAILGLVSRFIKGGTVRNMALVIYLFMGWMMLVAIKPLLANSPPSVLMWIAIGGLAYTVGVVFYAWEKLPYGHAVWHICVLGGSISHFFAVMNTI